MIIGQNLLFENRFWRFRAMSFFVRRTCRRARKRLKSLSVNESRFNNPQCRSAFDLPLKRKTQKKGGNAVGRADRKRRGCRFGRQNRGGRQIRRRFARI